MQNFETKDRDRLLKAFVLIDAVFSQQPSNETVDDVRAICAEALANLTKQYGSEEEIQAVLAEVVNDKE